MTVKFHEKNVSIFGDLQVSEGVPVLPSATDVMAVTELTADVTRETEAFEYLGDSLSRDEITTLKDTFADIQASTLMPMLGILDTGLAVDDAPFSKWFQACGGFVTVNGGTGEVQVSNGADSDDQLTIQYRKSSSEVSQANTQKVYEFFDCRGSVDIDFEAGSRATLGFKFLGNDSVPTMETEIVPDFGQQTTNVASVVRLQNMQTATIQEILGTEGIRALSNIVGDGTTVTVDFGTSHGLINGDEIKVENTTAYDTTLKIVTVVDDDTVTYLDTVSAAAETSGDVTLTAHSIQIMCVNSVSLPNFFGFDYSRFLLTCQEGFTKAGVPTDVTITVLEDEAGGTDFDPEANIEKKFQVILKYGTGVGKFVTIQMDTIQLATVKDAKVAQYQGKEISFRNIGKSKLIFN